MKKQTITIFLLISLIALTILGSAYLSNSDDEDKNQLSNDITESSETSYDDLVESETSIVDIESKVPETSIQESIDSNVTASSQQTKTNTTKNTSSKVVEKNSSVTYSDDEYINRVFVLVNQQRAKYNLPALKYSEKLNYVAKIRAKELSVEFDHNRPNDSNWSTILKSNNIRFSIAAENIAIGYKTPEAVVTKWMDSADHRKNILSPQFKYMGIGKYIDNKNVYTWDQLFVG